MPRRSDRRPGLRWSPRGAAATTVVATALALAGPGPVGAAAGVPDEADRVGTAPSELAVPDRASPTPTVTATPSPTPATTPTPGRVREQRTTDGEDERVNGRADDSRVPSLVGLTVAEARAALRRAGLGTGALAGLPDSARIVSQSRAEGENFAVAVTNPAPEPGEEPADGEGLAPTPAPSRSELDREELSDPTTAQIEELLAECDRLDREFDPAVLVVDDSVEMQVEQATRVPAGITLDVDAPSRQVIGVEDGQRVQLEVTCRVRAQLRAPAQDFAVDEPGWLEESLITSRTAQWSWFVTPHRTGSRLLELAVQPVITVESADGTGETTQLEATTLRHTIAVRVTAPPDQLVAGVFDRVGRLLQSVQGLLITLTAVVLAALGLWAALRRRDRAQTGASGDQGSDAAPPT